MRVSKIRGAAFQLPSKFNFLAGRRPPSRREWPLGHSPADAKALATADNSQRGAK